MLEMVLVQFYDLQSSLHNKYDLNVCRVENNSHREKVLPFPKCALQVSLDKLFLLNFP